MKESKQAQTRIFKKAVAALNKRGNFTEPSLLLSFFFSYPGFVLLLTCVVSLSEHPAPLIRFP